MNELGTCNVIISLYRYVFSNQLKVTIFQPKIQSIFNSLKKTVQFMLKIMHQFEFDMIAIRSSCAPIHIIFAAVV